MNDAMARTDHGGVRTRYYPRQLITPDDLTVADEYFVDRHRLHNRLLHGWGVVCGAVVCRATDPDGTPQQWKVTVSPGHAIDQAGNELAILADRVVDLRGGGVAVMPHDPAGELSDPWCSDTTTEFAGGRVWVAVRYKQGMTRPVRVQPAGCSCDDSSCEYSRWCDGYEVGLLDGCPPSHELLNPTRLPACPPDPDDPWVVLATVDVDPDGTVTAVDNCACRRLVLSLAAFWSRCQPTKLTVSKVETKPAGPFTQGQTGIEVNVTGTNIDQDATANLGEGVKVTATTVAAGTMTLTVRILKSAQPGDRALTITNPDCAIATAAKALTISPPTSAPASTKRRRS
jgi:hypothetical protein